MDTAYLSGKPLQSIYIPEIVNGTSQLSEILVPPLQRWNVSLHFVGLRTAMEGMI
jgi:hypothetical protein